jgi:propionate CoA-transferase
LHFDLGKPGGSWKIGFGERKMRVVDAPFAAELIKDGDTLLVGGSGAGHAIPDALLEAIGDRFRASGAPRQITSMHPVGLGDRKSRGAGHLAHEGLLKRVVCGTLVDAPRLSDLAQENKIEAYTLPQGALSHLIREMAAGRPGLITKVGMHTFVDPRQKGGRQSASATEDLVRMIEIDGEDYLHYLPQPLHVALLRGTTADEDGNISMEDEAIFGEMLSMAQAVRRCGGTVIVQVQRLAKRGALPGKNVKVPGMLVDYVVVRPDQEQTFATRFDPAYAGHLHVPMGSLKPMPLDLRKVIARRAAMELVPGAVCNLGAGISTGIGTVAAEEGIAESIVLTNEQGIIGGVPAMGLDAGAGRNYWAMVDQPYQFDFYDGGGLDLAFLSFGEIDRAGRPHHRHRRFREHQPGGQENGLFRNIHGWRTGNRFHRREAEYRAGRQLPQVRESCSANLI